MFQTLNIFYDNRCIHVELDQPEFIKANEKEILKNQLQPGVRTLKGLLPDPLSFMP